MAIDAPRLEWGWIGAVGAAAALLAVVAAPAYVGDGLRHFIMAGFSTVCHQMADRSPHLNGVQLAVCDRCMGIYGALALASAAYPFLKRWDEPAQRGAKFLIAAALLVPGIDWLGDAAGLWMNTPWSRLFTGAVFGSVAGYFFTRAVTALFASAEDGRTAEP